MRMKKIQISDHWSCNSANPFTAPQIFITHSSPPPVSFVPLISCLKPCFCSSKNAESWFSHIKINNFVNVADLSSYSANQIKAYYKLLKDSIFLFWGFWPRMLSNLANYLRVIRMRPTRPKHSCLPNLTTWPSKFWQKFFLLL